MPVLLAGFALAGALAACGAPGGGRTPRAVDAHGVPLASATSGRDVVPRPGTTLVASGDLALARGVHVLPPVSAPDDPDTLGTAGAIVLEGLSGVTLDLTGVVIAGQSGDAERDACRGWGIVLRNCDDVTVRGGTLSGYKGCIVAEDCRGLVIEDVTFDGWYSDRLRSTESAEDPSDWLWPHENDRGEWLARYGAAISLTDCEDAVVRRSRGRHGQNGILLVRSSGVQVHENDFSFLSGWGIALYRSSHNVVDHNRFDYCVRGYAHGAYWRGQDSAGILVFERSSDNVLAYNSATHGGDGLFLYGGQDVVLGRALERGETDPGGSDRNLIWRNDFSHAVANAVETTFSRDNVVLENRLVGSHQHGVWGGYSRGLVVSGNTIEDTLGGAVSIEHGQECVIEGNRIARNEAGVELWWDADPELVGGPFGRHHDTRSRDHALLGNVFEDNVQDLVLERTSGLALAGNTFACSDGARELKVSGLFDPDAPPTPGAADAADPRPRLFGADGSRPSGFVEETSLAASSGELPPALARARARTLPVFPERPDPRRPGQGGLATIVVGEWGPWDHESGEPRAVPRRAGGLLADARWQACWFAWTEACDPRGDLAAWRARRYQPLVQKDVANFASPWSDAGVRASVGDARFGLIARTELRAGEDATWRLSVLSDDGVRVLLDGQVVLENWTWHPPTRDEALLEVERGMHVLEVEYFQIDGAAALALDLTLVDPS